MLRIAVFFYFGLRMKLSRYPVFLVIAVCIDGAPQAGPNLNLPLESYHPRCRPPPCPSSGRANVSFPLDCVQYVECTDGVAKTAACPPDMYWNEASRKCADRSVTKCNQCWDSIIND